jgi:hypothetical protein
LKKLSSNVQQENWALHTCKWIKKHGREPKRESSNSLEKGCFNWLATSRKKFRKGIDLPEEDLCVLEQEDLFYIVEKSCREITSNSKTRKICLDIVRTGKEPGKYTEDAAWLKRKRLNRTKVYPSDLAIASEYGLPNLFYGVPLEMKSNIIAHSVCRWILEKGSEPSASSDNPYEKSLYNWMNNRRQAEKGNNSSKFYNSDRDIFYSYGLINFL